MDSPPAAKRQFMHVSTPWNSTIVQGQNNDGATMGNGLGDEPMDEVHEKMNEFQAARKQKDLQAIKAKANGWKEVIDDENDQILMGQFQTVAVQETLVIDRGSESYFVRNRRPRKRKLPNDEAKTSENTAKDSSENTKEKTAPTNYESDHSDISNTGLDDDDLIHLKNNLEKKAQLSTNVKVQGRVGDITAGQTMLRRKSLSRISEIIKGITDDQRLPAFFSRQLAEKNRDLIRRCIEKLGRDYCIKMLRKTLKIEARGGLMIKNQTRRRTPGGCFFKIIRSDPQNSKEVLDEIFIMDPTQNQKQDEKTSNVAQSIFDRMRMSGKNPPPKAGVNQGQMRKTMQLEKRRKAVADAVDSASYSVKLPPPPTSTDPRASREQVTYDDLFS